MPKISVIIPIYNMEKYLKQCIDSVKNQSLSDIEIICINDCSSDKSLSIVEEYAKSDSRFKVINHIQNEGWTTSLKDGLKIAVGEYIMFVDSDDWLELNACESAYNQIKSTGDDVVFFGTKLYYEKNEYFVVDTERLKPFKSKYKECESFNLKTLNRPFMSYGEIWYKIYSRNYFENNNLMEYCAHYYAGDMPLYIKVLVTAQSVSYINYPLYNYRLRADQSNSIKNALNYKLYIQNRARAYEIVKDTKDDYFLKWYLVTHINSHIAHFKAWTCSNPIIMFDYYNLLHDDFKNLEMSNNIEDLKDYVDYNKFKMFANRKFFVIVFLKLLLELIFSIKNEDSHLYKVITLFGIKIKFKTLKKQS